MREERNPESAMPLVLWPQTPEEFLFTPVEARLLRATLDEQIAQDSNIKLQVASARVTSREFSNYGYFVMLEIPQHVPAATPGLLSSGTGHATVGFRGKKRYPIMSFTFSKDGRLKMLEGCPCDGEPWSPEDCLALLRAKLPLVYIHTSSDKDWAVSEVD